ncbi:MAG: glycosyltransferase family 1 protein [Candidatus Fermentibacteria bacterium]|nr:glycosyltransferase family 1 protein [Candidatus Fermentibacteria bacterium]
MKIAFNIDYDHLMYTGIGRYGLELISAWLRTGQDCELWMWRDTKKNPPDIEGVEELIRYHPFPKRITDYFIPGIRAMKSNIQWVHSANGLLLPPSAHFKQANMVHDLGPMLYGHMKCDSDTKIWKQRLARLASASDCILVNSRSTMNDLLNVFPATEGKVFLTPLGIDHFSGMHTACTTRDHILTVGTVEPRKNIDGLLRAYSLLLQRRDVPPLVIAGKKEFRADEYQELSVKLGLQNKVTFAGFTTDRKLADLYSRAYCLVHPAHHEGFGFTVPEAFTWGLPVVASNTGGLGEFFSEAAWMVDPSDPESIAHGIDQALDSGVTPEQQKKRDDLSRELTWENCAVRTREALDTFSK